MTVAVVQFGGSNCDRDAVKALSHLGVSAQRVWHKDSLPEGTTGIVIPGGFSYGDYLRAGAMAAQGPIAEGIQEAAADGVPVLGVCNGAQIGCEARLTPGTFTTNADARFRCERVHLRVERTDTPWTSAYDRGDVITLPIAHGEGRFEIDDSAYARLIEQNRVLFRYCDADGAITDAANPNGSRDNIAGILGNEKTVAVMMPHPERATLPDLGPTDGRGILAAFAE
jgi:phosphoribosylformylglycinamidine synthase I